MQHLSFDLSDGSYGILTLEAMASTRAAVSSVDNAKLFAVGYIYSLSKRTSLYTTFSEIDNKGQAKYVLGGAAAARSLPPHAVRHQPDECDRHLGGRTRAQQCRRLPGYGQIHGRVRDPAALGRPVAGAFHAPRASCFDFLG